jgi:radical SAM superfamily enzyme YgiQ (UPF0313 family)
MKTFFINPPFKSEYGKFSRENRSPAITRSGTLYYPLWLIYAAAFCEKDGFEVEFLDAPAKPMNDVESFNYIKAHGEGTKLFIIETSTPSIVSDTAFADKLKEFYPDAFVVLVGTHPSALPEETLLNSKNVDAVARREFDTVTLELARSIRDGKNPYAVLGLTVRQDGIIKNNPDMPYLEDMDSIPFASEFIKKHLNYRDYFFAASSYPEIQIFTGRGCMARCNFCVYPQVMHGHAFRMRSPENVVDEFVYIKENFPDVKEVVIEDDTFTGKKDYVIAICKLLIERGLNKHLKWLCNARVNLDLETMKYMKKAGCRLIIPGIESGNQQILNNIKKGTKIEQAKSYVKNAKKAKLLVHACYMVGNKGETKETMHETLKFAIKLNTDTAQFYPLLPFPGTEAYNWAKENNYIKGTYNDYLKENGTINSLMELPDISGDEMVAFCDYARKKYYLRPRYIIYRIWTGLKNPDDLKRSLKSFSSIKNYLFKK